MRLRISRTSIVVFLAWLALPPAVAQAQSAIAGVVRDTSGAVMPGVTVEATSPALIEQVRSDATDEQGQYKIIDLRPGLYSVTFSLAGFATIKRDGIDLPANFTAQINTEMRVGELSETLTVTGGAPVVDVQSATSQQVMPQRLLDSMPTGGRSYQSVGATLVGVAPSSPDVGGSQGMQQSYLNAHGSDPRDNAVLVEGVRLNSMEGNGANQNYFNEGMFAEMAYQTGGIQVETSSGGIRLNLIPKDGGNTLKGDVFFSATSHNLQADSAVKDADPRQRAANAMDTMHDLNISVGGPVARDRLWFFASIRHWGVNQMTANSFYSASSTLNSFSPDTTRQVLDDNLIQSQMTRLTWQVSPRNKLSGYIDHVSKWRGHEQSSGGGVTGALWSEDSFGVRTRKAYFSGVIKWTGTWTSKLLFEAGIGMNNKSYSSGELQPGLLATNPIPKVDIATATYWGAPSAPYYPRKPVRFSEIAALSYVTGSHAVKFGFERSHGWNKIRQSFENPNVNFIERFSTGVPNSVAIFNTPNIQENLLNHDIGLYLQDTYTLNRLTLTPGIRFEYINGSYPQQSVPVSDQRLLLLEGYAAQGSAERGNLPNWKNWTPRLGVAYDVFGDGKTAVKTSFAKYLVSYSTDFAQNYNPMNQSTDIRTWTDVNRDLIYEPGIDTLGPSSNRLFGQVFRSPDPDLTREYNLEFTSRVQQQLLRGLSVSFGYFRRSYKNIIYSDNVALHDAGAFTPLAIANPCLTVTNPLAACGGTFPNTITVYSINPALSGVGTVIDRNSSRDSRVFNGFETQLMARYRGATVFGGTSTGRQVSNNCDLPLTISSTFAAASNPNATIFCDQTQFPIPYQTQVKVGGTYELPVRFVVSGTFQSYPGATNAGTGNSSAIWLPVTLTATRAIAPGLTQASESIPIIYPGSKYLDRMNQLDLRIARRFQAGRFGNVEVQIDLFNALNSRPVTAMSTSFGSGLNTPTAILQSRIISLGTQWHF